MSEYLKSWMASYHIFFAKVSALNDLNQYWVQSNFLYNSVKIEQLRLRACFLSKNFQNIFIFNQVREKNVLKQITRSCGIKTNFFIYFKNYCC